MLQHDPDSSQSAPDAAHTRIKGDMPATLPDAAPPTTQEIAQAIASLEARSASYTDEASQTVSEVIQHLGLDMTPEDVLAEVQAQRARQVQPNHTRNAIPKWLSALIALGFFTFSGIIFNSGMLTSPASPPAPVVAPAAFFPTPPHLSIAPNTLVQDTVGHTPVLKTLAEIPDNHPVQCGLASEGFAAGSGVPWILVKHSSKVYLRCWTVPMSAKAMQQASWGTGVTLFGVRGGFVGNVHATVPLTLSLGNMTVQNNDIDPSGFYLTVRNVRLDSHAYEKWQP